MSSSILKAQKVDSIDNNGFSETIKFEVLHQGNVEVNHNKFYVLELQQNPKTGEYRIFSHYGRLGKTNVYDVRGPSKDLAIVEKEYESVLAKKKKGKKVDGKIEAYVKVDTVMPTVGSENIRSKSTKTIVTKAAHIDTSSFTDSEVSRIIDQFVQENIHNITTKTTFTLTSNGFETPLGPVTKEHVQKARQPLNELNALMDKNGNLDENSRQVRDANNFYYSLIPHPFSHKITMSDWILKAEKLSEEFDLLDQLETAIQMGSAMNQGATQKLNAFGTEVEILKDRKEFDRIKSYVEKSRASNHKSIWNWSVKNIYKLYIPEERKRFESKGKQVGNIKELFHGSKNCNILSILKGGLIVPPANAGHVVGRMFGNGLYFAHNSTKSLNYSIGSLWHSGRGNKYPNTFLFLANVALGKPYETRNSFSGFPPKGYDSTHAKKQNTGLYNDEYIVYHLEQATLSYLVEMKK